VLCEAFKTRRNIIGVITIKMKLGVFILCLLIVACNGETSNFFQGRGEAEVRRLSGGCCNSQCDSNTLLALREALLIYVIDPAANKELVDFAKQVLGGYKCVAGQPFVNVSCPSSINLPSPSPVKLVCTVTFGDFLPVTSIDTFIGFPGGAVEYCGICVTDPLISKRNGTYSATFMLHIEAPGLYNVTSEIGDQQVLFLGIASVLVRFTHPTTGTTTTATITTTAHSTTAHSTTAYSTTAHSTTAHSTTAHSTTAHSTTATTTLSGSTSHNATTTGHTGTRNATTTISYFRIAPGGPTTGGFVSNSPLPVGEITPELGNSTVVANSTDLQLVQ